MSKNHIQHIRRKSTLFCIIKIRFTMDKGSPRRGRDVCKEIHGAELWRFMELPVAARTNTGLAMARYSSRAKCTETLSRFRSAPEWSGRKVLVKPFSILLVTVSCHPSSWECSKRDWIIRSNARTTSCTTMRREMALP